MTFLRTIALALSLAALAGCGGGTDGVADTVADIQASGSSGGNGNHAPLIGGTPATSVVAGARYLFTPTASDADGYPLTFDVTGKPAWASFDSRTGMLAGTPASADVGSSSTIVISVTDGTETASLPAFTLKVVAGSSQGLDITGTSRPGYQWDTLATGKAVYVDRSYTYTSVPQAYVGLSYVRTANDDKTSTGDNFFSFVVNQPVTVFVAHDTRITSKPAWLSGWSDTGDQLGTTDATLHLYSKTFPAGTVTLGGNGGAGGSMYTVLVAAQGGGGGGTAVPFANADSATTSMNNPVTVDVLANDTGLADAPVTVTLISAPSHGTAVVNADQTIRYTPATDFAGADTLNYQVRDADGDIATAAVTIQVTCTNCAAGVTLALAWDPNPAADQVQGYIVYYGATGTTATVELSNIPVTASGFNPSAPGVSYDAWNDLKLKTGDSICFRVKAYNMVGTSGYSSAVCGTI